MPDKCVNLLTLFWVPWKQPLSSCWLQKAVLLPQKQSMEGWDLGYKMIYYFLGLPIPGGQIEITCEQRGIVMRFLGSMSRW